MSKGTRWDQDLSVTAEADGLTGHAGAVLLRKLADQCGLTAALGAALARAGKFPLLDRGVALVPVAIAWRLITATPAGFPWQTIAGKTLAGWLVLDMDATLITAHSPALGTRS